MATSPPFVPGVMRATLRWTIGANTTPRTVLHLAYTGGPPSTSDCNSIAGQVNSACAANMPGYMPSNVALNGVDILDLSSATGKNGTVASTHAGARTGHQMDAGTATTVNWHIARRYRGGKPKSFFPFGVAEDLTDPQTWSSSYQSSINTIIGTFLTAIAAITSGSTIVSSLTSVSLHQGYNPPTTLPSGRVKQTAAYRTTALVDPISTGVCHPNPGSQRRRVA